MDFLKRLKNGKITKKEKEAFTFTFFSWIFFWLLAGEFRDWFVNITERYLPNFTINLLGEDLHLTSLVVGFIGVYFLYKLLRVN